jgi:AGZA family xanthine/uracil permease-like MFS transporter
MMDSFGKIEWGDFDESLPAFFTAVMMPFAGGITNGIAAGFIMYVLVKIFKGKFKEVHPIMYIVTLLFVANFVISAL